MFTLKSVGISKYLVAFSMIGMLAACSDDDGGPVFNPDVPPANVQVVAGDDDSTDSEVQNTISWTKDPAATDYVVYWNNTGDDITTSSSQLAVPDGFSNVVHTGSDVVPGGDYFYRVQALAGGESSVLSDQVTGTPQQSAIDQNLNDVAWNGVDTLVAVGDAGVIITSPNGTADAWSQVLPEPTVESLGGITWGNNQFLVVGAGLTVLTWDGNSLSNWVPQNLDNIAAATNSADLEDVAWVEDRYVAVGKNRTIVTSSDGSVWNVWIPTNNAIDDAITLQGVATNDDGSKVVAVGTNGTLLISNDRGDTWDPVPLNETNSLNDVTWDGDDFVVVGSGDTIWTSPDGDAWTQFIPGTANTDYVGVTQWDSGLPTDPIVAAVGSAGDFIVSDGSIVLSIETGTNQEISAITWVDNYFVMVGHNGTVLTSKLNQ